MMLKEWLNTTGFEKTREAKKMAKIKKKLMTLEIERCQKKMTHCEVTAVDKKIADHKSAYAKMCEDKR